MPSYRKRVSGTKSASNSGASLNSNASSKRVSFNSDIEQTKIFEGKDNSILHLKQKKN